LVTVNELAGSGDFCSVLRPLARFLYLLGQFVTSSTSANRCTCSTFIHDDDHDRGWRMGCNHRDVQWNWRGTTKLIANDQGSLQSHVRCAIGRDHSSSSYMGGFRKCRLWRSTRNSPTFANGVWTAHMYSARTRVVIHLHSLGARSGWN
jgi:hypothetical protein